jgi:hypothetical protein
MISKFSSLIRVAAITLVVTLMASVMTAAYAGGDCDKVAGTWYGKNQSDIGFERQLATMQITKLKFGEKKIMITMDQFNEAFLDGPQFSRFQGEFRGDAKKVNDGVWHFTLKAHSQRGDSNEGFVVLTGVIKHEGCDSIFLDGTACVYPNLDALHEGPCSATACSDFTSNYRRWELKYNQNRDDCNSGDS